MTKRLTHGVVLLRSLKATDLPQTESSSQRIFEEDEARLFDISKDQMQDEKGESLLLRKVLWPTIEEFA